MPSDSPEVPVDKPAASSVVSDPSSAGTTKSGDIAESTKKAFDFAADSVKQLIGLATAFVAFTITFVKDLVPQADVHFLWSSWLLFGISAGLGLACLLALTGQLGAAKTREPDINYGGVRLLAASQILLFLVGLGLAIIFGYQSISKRGLQSKIDDPKNQITIQTAEGTWSIPKSQANVEISLLPTHTADSVELSCANPELLLSEARLGREDAIAQIRKSFPDAQIVEAFLGVNGAAESCQRPPGHLSWNIATTRNAPDKTYLYQLDASSPNSSPQVKEIAVIEQPVQKSGVRRYFCPMWPICR
jgi:RNase P/RNase MRP subunit p29